MQSAVMDTGRTAPRRRGSNGVPSDEAIAISTGDRGQMPPNEPNYKQSAAYVGACVANVLFGGTR